MHQVARKGLLLCLKTSDILVHPANHRVEIKPLENPRKEAEAHYYNPTYQGLLDIGVEPHYLTDEVMAGMFEMVERHADNIRKEVIFRGVKW